MNYINLIYHAQAVSIRPQHLIDEYGYSKHLLNCQSKLKKRLENVQV